MGRMPDRRDEVLNMAMQMEDEGLSYDWNSITDEGAILVSVEDFPQR